MHIYEIKLLASADRNVMIVTLCEEAEEGSRDPSEK